MTDNGNGNHAAPRTITLPDSGAVLTLKFIGPMLAKDIQRSIRKRLPKPQPPQQTVIDGDGHSRQEANDADPDYIDAVSEWRQAQGFVFIEELVRWGVEVAPDAAAVAAFRAQAADLELPPDDKVVWVTRLMLKTTRDLTALQGAILGEFQPTEAAVTEAVEAFRSDIPGAQPS